MVDRLRALLEEPHDPAVARIVVWLACAVTLGLTIVVGLGGAGGSDHVSRPLVRTRSAAASSSRPTPPPAERSTVGHRPEPRQDPQDRRGSAARHRAEHELASHRALQHVPYRRGGISISLGGARGGRAILVARGPTRALARRGYHRFLLRFHDSGANYLPRFGTRRTPSSGAVCGAASGAAPRAARGAAITQPRPWGFPHQGAVSRPRPTLRSSRHIEACP